MLRSLQLSGWRSVFSDHWAGGPAKFKWLLVTSL